MVLEAVRKRRREGASPFFRRPLARRAVVAEGAGIRWAVEVMVKAVTSIQRQDQRLMSFMTNFPTHKWIEQLNE